MCCHFGSGTRLECLSGVVFLCPFLASQCRWSGKVKATVAMLICNVKKSELFHLSTSVSRCAGLVCSQRYAGRYFVLTQVDQHRGLNVTSQCALRSPGQPLCTICFQRVVVVTLIPASLQLSRWKTGIDVAKQGVHDAVRCRVRECIGFGSAALVDQACCRFDATFVSS